MGSEECFKRLLAFMLFKHIFLLPVANYIDCTENNKLKAGQNSRQVIT